MGGEAAKERRRLKRLQGSDGAASTPSSSAATTTMGEHASTSTQLIVNKDKESRISDADAARMRLQRKLARKAGGKFKPQAQSSPNYSADKRKLEDMDDNFREAKRPSKRLSSGIHNDRSARRNTPTNSRSTPTDRKGKQPMKKEKEKHPSGQKKPKHLKRKMDQLSKTIAEGTSISDLDNQMKILQEQMEAYKRLKLKSETDHNEEVPSPGGVSEVNDDTKGMSDNKLGAKVQERDIGDSEGIVVKKSSVEQAKSKVDDDKKQSSTQMLPKTSDGDSSSDEDDIVESLNARSRGKRRRGRRDNAPKEDFNDNSDGSNKSEAKDPSPNAIQENHDNEAPAEVGSGDTSPTLAEDDNSPPSTKKTPKKDDKRRCIGRKPITDYVVGDSYSGTVKYIKPKLGAFIDIGSHSDAFCHISCISDEFVSSVADILKVDDVVQNARVVEVDRDKKRITVSLRSEEMRENELEMLKSTREYESNGAKKRDRRKSGEGVSKNRPAKNDSAVPVGGTESNNKLNPPIQSSDPAKSTGDQKVDAMVLEGQNKIKAGGLSEDSKQLQGLSSDASTAHRSAGADLKRERKLARRAERRAANGNASQ